MYVDPSRPKPMINGSDAFRSKSWWRKQGECCTKKRKGVYSDVNPSRVQGAADTCERVCVTNSVVRKYQKGQDQVKQESVGGSCQGHVNDAPFLFFSCWSKLLSTTLSF
ncbi:unnamed protein product [Sphenostylis stenocarpa]|uniref:Uncharacterized protein n=1 Tax=Sphenostylis stenocarpa TaxID=92480 RepID=A0AA86VZ74_9FABA|nr:unnamed protein product [Sphenostylis stenocarpa]